jgi:hypothetical protein
VPTPIKSKINVNFIRGSRGAWSKLPFAVPGKKLRGVDRLMPITGAFGHPFDLTKSNEPPIEGTSLLWRFPWIVACCSPIDYLSRPQLLFARLSPPSIPTSSSLSPFSSATAATAHHLFPPHYDPRQPSTLRSSPRRVTPAKGKKVRVSVSLTSIPSCH